MTITRADIAEYDVVALLKEVEGVADERGEEADVVYAPPEDLRLIEKWPPGGPKKAGD